MEEGKRNEAVMEGRDEGRMGEQRREKDEEEEGMKEDGEKKQWEVLLEFQMSSAAWTDSSGSLYRRC